jgi:hypothetical protein
MPPPFRKLTVAEVEDQIAAFRFTRAIKFIDTHHTWRPRKADYKGEDTINAIFRFHTMPVKIVNGKNVGGAGFADIGEHWTIGPEGAIWTGRDLDRPPCSQTGFNANALMYEMIGDFDGPDVKGPHDTLDGAQREAAVAISAAVLARFKLPLSAVRFHRDLHAPGQPQPKTCPGTSVVYQDFQREVAARCLARWNYTPGGAAPLVASAFDPGEGGSSHAGTGFV